MKKKKFESRNSNDSLQQPLYDSDPSTVESELGEKKIRFGNETSSFETNLNFPARVDNIVPPYRRPSLDILLPSIRFPYFDKVIEQLMAWSGMDLKMAKTYYQDKECQGRFLDGFRDDIKYDHVGPKTQDRKKAKYYKDDQVTMKDLKGKS
ncbi:hypothetical protein Tco_1455606 [Tanacetum coccineum]